MAVWDLKKHLDRIYRKNPQNNSYIIDIQINHYRDLFNDLDPSPLRKRDLDQDFIAYLEESSAEIPVKYPIELEIHCAFSEELKEREERIRMGVQTYYRSLLLSTDHKIFLTLRRSLFYLAVGGLFLFLSFFLSPKLREGYIDRIIIEGMNIGGWVFVWEALASLSFTLSRLRKEKKRLLRLMEGGIRFQYKDKEDYHDTAR